MEEERLEERFHAILRSLKPSIPDIVTFRESGRGATSELGKALHELPLEAPVLFVVDNVPEAPAGTAPKPLRT